LKELVILSLDHGSHEDIIGIRRESLLRKQMEEETKAKQREKVSYGSSGHIQGVGYGRTKWKPLRGRFGASEEVMSGNAR
jgi:hypothetical protein